MNCKYCDSKVTDDAKFCTKCGKPVELEKRLEIKGIGGWLSFFLFGLFVSIILNLSAGINDALEILKIEELDNVWVYILLFLNLSYYGGLIAFVIYTIRAFSKLKENAVSLGKMYLIIIFSTNLIDVLISGFTDEGAATKVPYLDSKQMVVRSLIFSIIWFLYLTLSKRVSSTFPKENRKIKKTR